MTDDDREIVYYQKVNPPHLARRFFKGVLEGACLAIAFVLACTAVVWIAEAVRHVH